MPDNPDGIDEKTFQVFQDSDKILKSEKVTQQTCQLLVTQETRKTRRTHRTSLRIKQFDQQLARTSNTPVLWSCNNLFCYRFIFFVGSGEHPPLRNAAQPAALLCLSAFPVNAFQSGRTNLRFVQVIRLLQKSIIFNKAMKCLKCYLSLKCFRC